MTPATNPASEFLYNVRCYNGDELLCIFTGEDENHYFIEDPLLITDHKGLVPWLQFVDTRSFKILRQHVVIHSPMSVPAQKLYLDSLDRVLH